MDLNLLFILFAVVGIAITVWWVLMLVEVVRTPQSAWAASGQNQLIYVLLMIFLGVLGTLIYVLVARPKLRAGVA